MKKHLVSLIIFLGAMIPTVTAYAAVSSWLEVNQLSYDVYTESGSIGLPVGGSDPTLMDSSNTKTIVGTHNGHTEARYEMSREYESAAGAVSYSDFPVFNGLPIAITIAPGHSASFASGYASAQQRIIRGRASVISEGATRSNTESWSEGSFDNTFTVLPGTSGLAAGDTARIRLDVRLDGRLSATGMSWPVNGNAFPHMLAGLTIKDPLVRIDTGEGWFTPSSVSFGANADIDAGYVNRNYWPQSYSSYWEGSWRASTNTGAEFSGDYDDTVHETAENSEVTTSYTFDTGQLQLEFDAIVGHTFNFNAYLDVYSFVWGYGSALSDFSATFGPAIIDANGTGVSILWEAGEASPVPIPPAVLLFGTGLAGLFGLRKRVNQG